MELEELAEQQASLKSTERVQIWHGVLLIHMWHSWGQWANSFLISHRIVRATLLYYEDGQCIPWTDQCPYRHSCPPLWAWRCNEFQLWVHSSRRHWYPRRADHDHIPDAAQLTGSGRKRIYEPFCTLPFALDGDFVDRPDILTWVRNKCAQPGGRAALVGLGGVG